MLIFLDAPVIRRTPHRRPLDIGITELWEASLFDMFARPLCAYIEKPLKYYNRDTKEIGLLSYNQPTILCIEEHRSLPVFVWILSSHPVLSATNPN